MRTLVNICGIGFFFFGLWQPTCEDEVQVATYYVDVVNGSDDYDGLSPAFRGGVKGPWKTMSKVNETKFLPGDSILFKRDGVWNDGPLNPRNGGVAGGVVVVQDSIIGTPIRIELVDLDDHHCIYFGAYGRGEKPKIDCQGKKGLIIQHNYIIVADLHLDNGGNNMLQFNAQNGNYWNVVKDVEITRCAGNAVRFSKGGGNNWLNGLYVYDYKVNGIYLAGSPLNPLQQVLVENCRVEKPFVIEGEDGISCHRNAEDYNIAGDIIIRNNTIIRSGEDGIDITSGTNILLEANKIEHCYTGGIFTGKTRVNTVEIRGNFLKSNSIKKGIGDLTITCSNVRVIDNIVCGTGHHSVLLRDASQVQFWNNTISPSDRTGNFLRLRGELKAIEFKNNIFDFSNTDQKINGSLDSIVFDHNCYASLSDSQAIREDKSFHEMKSNKADFEPNGIFTRSDFSEPQSELSDQLNFIQTSICSGKGARLSPE